MYAKGTKSDQKNTSTRDSQLQHVRIKQAAAAPPQEKESTGTTACHSPVNKAAESSTVTSLAPVVCRAIAQRHKHMYKLKGLFSHVQEVQSAGKTLNEIRTQIIRHAARM